MTYQNVSTPRIYLNIPEYLASTGTAIDNVFRTLPVSASAITAIPDISSVALTDSDGNSTAYIALLGHALTSYTIDTYSSDIINGTQTSCAAGFSISKLSDQPGSITTSGDVGSIVFGTYFDFPHSPDLDLSLSYDYSGVKEITTKGGNTLSNKFYSAPPKWGSSLGAWELGGTAAHAKSGRRIWDLSFSYLSDSSVFPDNAGLVNETSTTDTTGSGSADSTLLADDTIQRVIHLTQGSHLPFIFQADNSVAKPDSFAICKFDMNSFKFDQVANSVYNCKIRIREVW